MQRANPPAKRRWLTWLMIAGAGALVLALGATAYTAAVLPGCESCHDDSEFVAATAAAPHAEIDCASCHVGTAAADRVSFGARQVFHMQLRVVSGEGRDWEVVPDTRCRSCHEDIDQAVASSGGLKIAHVTCAVGSECTDCHSATGHGTATAWVRVYDMETCLECHVSQANSDCDLCHAGQLASDRIASGTFAITHGPEWEKTHGMGDGATCAACHTAASCEKCHGVGLPHASGFVDDHAEFAVSEQAQCNGCHEPAFCSNCHGLEMPHPTTFIRGHSDAAEANEALCQRCHAGPDCTQCHETHVHPGGAIGSGG